MRSGNKIDESLTELSVHLTTIAEEFIQSLSKAKEGFRESTHGAAFRKIWEDLGEGFSTRNASGGITYHGLEGESEDCNPADFLSMPQELFLNILYNKLENLKAKADDEKDNSLKSIINFMLISMNYTFARQNNYKQIKGHAFPVCPISYETISDLPQKLQLISSAKIAAEYDEKGHEVKAARETKIIVCSKGQFIAKEAIRTVADLKEKELKQNLFSEEDIKRIQLSTDLISENTIIKKLFEKLWGKEVSKDKFLFFCIKGLMFFYLPMMICDPLIFFDFISANHILYPIVEFFSLGGGLYSFLGIELFKTLKNGWTQADDKLVIPSIENHPEMVGLAQGDRPEEANALIAKISRLVSPIRDVIKELNVHTRKKKEEEIRKKEAEQEAKKKSVSTPALVSLRMSSAQAEEKTLEARCKLSKTQEVSAGLNERTLAESTRWMSSHEPNVLTVDEANRDRTLTLS